MISKGGFVVRGTARLPRDGIEATCRRNIHVTTVNVGALFPLTFSLSRHLPVAPGVPSQCVSSCLSFFCFILQHPLVPSFYPSCFLCAPVYSLSFLSIPSNRPHTFPILSCFSGSRVTSLVPQMPTELVSFVARRVLLCCPLRVLFHCSNILLEAMRIPWRSTRSNAGPRLSPLLSSIFKYIGQKLPDWLFYAVIPCWPRQYSNFSGVIYRWISCPSNTTDLRYDLVSISNWCYERLLFLNNSK